MARLHAITIPDSLRNQFSYGIETLDLPDEMATHPFSTWLAWVKIYIEQNISPDLRKGLIHGDIFFNNIVISPDREPVIMDFEEAGDYYRIFDLGMAIAGLCWEHGNVNHAKIKPLVDGYQSIDPLNEIETNTLKSFIVYAAAVTACWRFRQFNLTTPNEKLKDRYLEMQQLADQVWGIPDCEFVAHLK
jgi:homoserine kinase type II